MNFRAAFHATAAGACLLVAACGGGGGGGDSNTNPSNGGGNGSTGSGSGGSSGSGSGGTTCQPPTPTTIVGGDLFVAEQGPVGVTLLSNGGLNQYTFAFLYDNVFGISTNNPQDKWGAATPLLFPPGTPVGTSAQVVLQPPAP